MTRISISGTGLIFLPMKLKIVPRFFTTPSPFNEMIEYNCTIIKDDV